MANQGPNSQTILVVGGGIAGITAAVEAVEYDVKTACCGGTVSVMKPEKRCT